MGNPLTPKCLDSECAHPLHGYAHATCGCPIYNFTHEPGVTRPEEGKLFVCAVHFESCFDDVAKEGL